MERSDTHFIKSLSLYWISQVFCQIQISSSRKIGLLSQLLSWWSLDSHLYLFTVEHIICSSIHRKLQAHCKQHIDCDSYRNYIHRRYVPKSLVEHMNHRWHICLHIFSTVFQLKFPIAYGTLLNQDDVSTLLSYN